MTDYLIPVLFLLVLLLGLCRRVDVLSVFVQGAKEGLRTGVSLLPTLTLLMTCVGMCRASGGLDMVSLLLSPLTERLGLPAPVTPLALLRPVSGSGALVLFEGLLRQYGPDSTVGRVASVLMGGSETTFYTLAVYFGAVGVRKTGRALPAALTGDLATALCSALFVRLMLR